MCSNHKCSDVLNIFINMDGIPISISSSVQFLPIHGLVVGISLVPFVIGCYYNIMGILEKAKILVRNGLLINGVKNTIHFNGIICDAPARAFVKGIKGHRGYSSCEK